MCLVGGGLGGGGGGGGGGALGATWSPKVAKMEPIINENISTATKGNQNVSTNRSQNRSEWEMAFLQVVLHFNESLYMLRIGGFSSIQHLCEIKTVKSDIKSAPKSMNMNTKSIPNRAQIDEQSMLKMTDNLMAGKCKQLAKRGSTNRKHRKLDP